MIAFVKHTLVFLTPFLFLFFLGGTYDPEEGDLVRMAYLTSFRKYSLEQNELNQSDDLQISDCCPVKNKYTEQPSVAIFGDSFVPGLMSSLSAKKNVIAFNIHDYEVKNPFVLSLSLKDSLSKLQPGIIIIETIERALLGRLEGMNSRQSSERKDENASNQAKPLEFSFIEKTKNGLFRLATLLDFAITGSQKNVHHWDAIDLPLHVHKTLHTIKSDLTSRREKYNNVDLLLGTAHQKIQQAFPQSEIQFLIIPDKLTFYEDYLTTPPSCQSILSNIDWAQSFFQIQLIPELEVAREKELLEIYKYSGTHFGEKGNEICANAIDEFIETKFD